MLVKVANDMGFSFISLSSLRQTKPQAVHYLRIMKPAFRSVQEVWHKSLVLSQQMALALMSQLPQATY
jgi:hypothetical protein